MNDETFKHLLEKHLPDVLSKLIRNGMIAIDSKAIIDSDIEHMDIHVDIPEADGISHGDEHSDIPPMRDPVPKGK